MATSKCASCKNSYFELVEHTPQKSKYKLMFIQCSSCGNVVGTMDYFNIGAMLDKIEKKLDERMDTLENQNHTINDNLRSIVNKIK